MKPYPAYKDSGIAWLGEVPEGWEVTKVKFLSLTPVQYGLNIGAENYVQDGVRFIRTTDIDDYGNLMEEGVFLPKHLVPKEYLLHEGDFLVSRSGTVGRAYVHSLNDNQFSYAGYLVRFTFNSLSVAKLLFYFTKSNIFNVWLESTGIESTIVNVNGQKYANLSLALPTDPAEQTAIAAYLDRKTGQIDTLIERKRRLIELLQEYRPALISRAVTKGLNPAAPMKDSGIEWIGEVPEGWEVVKLKYLTTKVGSGVTPKGGASVYQQDGIPLIRSQNVQFNGLKMNDIAYISEAIHETMKTSKVYPEDVLLNITGASIGRCCIAPTNIIEANVNQHVCIVRPNKKISSKFLQAYLASDKGQTQIFSGEKGISREGLNFEELKSFDVVFPPPAEQTAITTYLDKKTAQIDRTIARTEQQIELLQEYRTALISAAVTGKIDVREEALESQG